MLSKASLIFLLLICLFTVRGHSGIISTMWRTFWEGSILVANGEEDGRPMGARILDKFELSGIN